MPEAVSFSPKIRARALEMREGRVVVGKPINDRSFDLVYLGVYVEVRTESFTHPPYAVLGLIENVVQNPNGSVRLADEDWGK